MPQDPNSQFAEAERAELARVVQALGKRPRLARLMQYMGEKVFSGESDYLNEYNIATEVLGRSKAVFNAGEDSIARVETHRLRKRLAEFYDSEGKDHSVQVSLPPGTYVPRFSHKPEPERATGVATAGQTEAPQSAPEPIPGSFESGRRISRWLYLVSATALAGILLVVFVYFRTGPSNNSGSRMTTAGSAPGSKPAGGEIASSAVRLLAGYKGPPKIDSAGTTWYSDQYFSGGTPYQPSLGPIARTSDPFLFERFRTGDFSYSIPLKPGTYELHLFFSTPVPIDVSTTFNVDLNGKRVLGAFDVNSDALGTNIGDERILRDVSPDKDGFLHLVFSGGSGSPFLNALEILPGTPHAQLPIRIIMQTRPSTDHEGRFWHPDNYYMGGRLGSTPQPIVNSADPDVFSGERFGHFTYALPVDPRGRYTLILHFVELYFGPGTPGKGGTGSRVFDVICNGQTLLSKFDIYKEAGSLHEIAKTFSHLQPSPEGKLNLTFEPVVNNATVSGIEVLDESH
jgi:hypothetical protein